MAKYLRCYMCSDLHAANRTYRKLLNAIKMNVYEAQVVLIAGDLTGKAIVPIIKQSNGRYTASFLDQHYLIDTEAELEKLKNSISDIGYYPYVTDQEEVDALRTDTAKMSELFRQKMIERVGEWVAMAEERIGKSGIQFYMMPGNDDDRGVDEMIARSSYVVNPVGNTIHLNEYHEMISFDYANPTPWHTPREWSEEEYYEHIKASASTLKNVQNALFMIHVPPFDTGIDTAPELDKTMRPKVTMGDVLRVPVGSTGVRKAIQELQPLVTVHGHVHEAGGQSKLGRTTCFNAGSEANQGILRGFVFDLGKDKLERAFRVQG
ncbi:MAG: metallophosphoesterase [Chloroflexi bacterium]|nr:MAG: metallophosphoesterase [Chloroflexota bacterium]